MRTLEETSLQKVVKLGSLQHGEICKTQSCKYLQAWCWGFRNELGITHYGWEADELCEILPNWPLLQEGEYFCLYTELGRNPNPYQTLIFETDSKFKFRIKMDDYRITIPFQFKTVDQRVNQATAEWSARSGKILRLLKDQPLHITFNDTPKLHIGYSGPIIPKQ